MPHPCQEKLPLTSLDREGQQHGLWLRAGAGVACRGKAHRCASGASCLIPPPELVPGTPGTAQAPTFTLRFPVARLT